MPAAREAIETCWAEAGDAEGTFVSALFADGLK
jgi:hypothetical protein